MHVLGNSHAPQDDGSTRCGVKPRHFTQRFSWNAAHRSHEFWRIANNIFLERFVILGAFGDEIPIRQAFSDDHIQQRSEEHTSELQSLMRISYAVFCLKK